MNLVKDMNSLLELHGLTVGADYDHRYLVGKQPILYTVYRKVDMKIISKPMRAYCMKRWFAGFVAGMSDAGTLEERG